MTAAAPGTIIRTAQARDAGAIAQVHVAAWRESYGGLLPAPMLAALSVEMRERSWNTMLSDLPAARLTTVLVAEQGGEIVGFASCGAQRDPELAAAGFPAEISAIYLLARCKRERLGTRLMTESFSALSEAGFRSASLWVLRDNAPARRFYEALGGEVIGEKEDRRGTTALVELAYGWRSLAVPR
ncbi:MAG TPA: GNAT family N-acetyltransferase [Bosea sp. (in: a-proteobacteria)]|jgi:ribosomal protein S18 acetylase RimI-like enzyme|uniref:GNAT family N-acetyltransferase n=1 Tax=Bosea sp. (in: a-proteobacteria) TaxID=1871050 RepID=UPI002E0D7900|nr:GNAT family N-acetyltransferase [Bosea sp. (in: a-proteobacteria)]